MKLCYAVVVVTALTVALGAKAVAAQRGTSWLLGAGLSLPAGDFNSYANNGWGVIAGAERPLGSRSVALRLDLSLAQNRDLTASGIHESTRLTSALTSFVYHFQGARPHLYALAGAGFFHRRFSSDDPDELPINTSHVAIQFGEGLIIPVQSVKLFIEGRFVTSLGVEPFRFFPVVVGVRLGGGRP